MVVARTNESNRTLQQGSAIDLQRAVATTHRGRADAGSEPPCESACSRWYSATLQPTCEASSHQLELL